MGRKDKDDREKYDSRKNEQPDSDDPPSVSPSPPQSPRSRWRRAMDAVRVNNEAKSVDRIRDEVTLQVEADWARIQAARDSATEAVGQRVLREEDARQDRLRHEQEASARQQRADDQARAHEQARRDQNPPT